jgi:RHS repeat-associated protein
MNARARTRIVLLALLPLFASINTYAQSQTLGLIPEKTDTAAQPRVAPPPPPPEDGEPLYNGAGLITSLVPSTMETNGIYEIRVAMRNNGTTTWTPALGYTLASKNPDNNMTWGVNRVSVGYNIDPGDRYDFYFQVRAPSMPGTYSFNWGMLQENVEWIGGSTVNIVTVNIPSSGGTAPAQRVQAAMVAIGMLLDDDGTDSSGSPGIPPATFDPPPVNGPNGTISYVHTDALGSPVVRTDTSGHVESTMRYEPYGLLVTGVRLTLPAIGFTGHVNDADTGLVYMQQRYYDPVAGNFLSNDPISSDTDTGGNFNRYNYAQNNPFRYIDPDGMQSCGSYMCDRYVFDSTSNTVNNLKQIFQSAVDGGRIAMGEAAGSTVLESDFENKLWGMYVRGRVAKYQLSDSEFKSIVLAATPYSDIRPSAVTFSDGSAGLAQLVSTYGNKEMGYAIGSATLYLQNGTAVGLRDTYDFDPKPWGERPRPAEIVTRVANGFSQTGQSGFKVCYGKKIAGGGC